MRGPGANVKTQYAVQAVIYLARQERLQVVPVSEIAAAVGISPKFLEDILGALRAAGIVQSRRGKTEFLLCILKARAHRGILRLAKPVEPRAVNRHALVPSPAGLSVLELAQVMEGPAAAAREPGGPIAQVTARAFDRALDAATAALAELTIEQLVEEARRLEAERAAAYMYHL